MIDLAALQARVAPEFEQIVHALARLVLMNPVDQGGEGAPPAASTEQGNHQPRSTVAPGDPVSAGSAAFTGSLMEARRVADVKQRAPPLLDHPASPLSIATPLQGAASSGELSPEALQGPGTSASQKVGELPAPRATLRPAPMPRPKTDAPRTATARLRLAPPRAPAARPVSPPGASAPASAAMPSKAWPSHPADHVATGRGGDAARIGSGRVPGDALLTDMQPQWPAPRLLEGAPWRADGANAQEPQPDPFANAALEQRIADLLTEAARASGLDY